MTQRFSSMHCRHLASCHQAGFSLAELMIAMCVATIVTAVMVTMYNSQSKTYRRENLMTEMQQNSRAAMEIFGREIRIAGLDEEGKRKFFVTDVRMDANNNSTIQFTSDIGKKEGLWDPCNGKLDTNEYFSYSLYNSSLTPSNSETDLGRTTTDKGERQLVAEGIEVLSIAYAYDNDSDFVLDNYDANKDGKVDENEIIWAIDSDGDNDLDMVVDSNFDGTIGFFEPMVPLSNLLSTSGVPFDTDISTTKIGAVRIWMLVRARHEPLKYVGNQSNYRIGHRQVTLTDDQLAIPRFVVESKFELRNLNVQFEKVDL